MDEHVRQLVMITANLPVSIPRGRGRRVVTLYEAQIRRLATGRVYRRASVMDFIRLVQSAAAATPEACAASAPTARPPAAITLLQDRLAELQNAAGTAEATQWDRAAVDVYELLLDLVESRQNR